MTIAFDTGALIGIDRGRRDLLSRLQTAFENGDWIRAPAGVIGQVWRDGGCQTLLSRAQSMRRDTAERSDSPIGRTTMRSDRH